MFFYEFCKISKNIFFYRTPPVAASDTTATTKCKYYLQKQPQDVFCKKGVFKVGLSSSKTESSLTRLWRLIIFEIIRIFLIKPFFCMTKKSRQNFKYLENEESYRGKTESIFIIFKRISVPKNCLRPESAPFTGKHLNLFFLRKLQAWRTKKKETSTQGFSWENCKIFINT